MMPVETEQSTSTAPRTEKSVVQEIVERVADELGEDPFDLPVLHDVVDTDALNSLVDGSSDADALCVTFSYAGCRIEVTGSGAVTVTS